jgi:hypothetical protein
MIGWDRVASDLAMNDADAPRQALSHRQTPRKDAARM